jgi:hypothetical protein
MPETCFSISTGGFMFCPRQALDEVFTLLTALGEQRQQVSAQGIHSYVPHLATAFVGCEKYAYAPLNRRYSHEKRPSPCRIRHNAINNVARFQED